MIGLVGTYGPGRAALDRLVQLHREGVARLEEAAALFQDGQYREALDLAKQTKVRYANLFGGLPGARHAPNVARDAAALIKEIEADPRTREAIQEYEAVRRFKRIAILEQKLKEDRAKYYDIYKLLGTIAKRYPDCPTGHECVRRLRELRADRELYGLIKSEGKRRYIAAALRRAEQYERSDLHEQAAAEYQELSRKFRGKTIEELRRMARKRNGAA
ncbi:MAG: hypothetical protein JXQ75_07875 [Phycisphaerae bacterium]|nr:hypothetical protein [Phycisphaerae bacterium]